MSLLQHPSSVSHSSLNHRAQQLCPSRVQLKAGRNAPYSYPRYYKGYGAASRRLCSAASSNHGTTDSTSGLYSLGVQLRPYNDQEALAAVSNKSFACTMCGKCCTMAEDSEVTQQAPVCVVLFSRNMGNFSACMAEMWQISA